MISWSDDSTTERRLTSWELFRVHVFGCSVVFEHTEPVRHHLGWRSCIHSMSLELVSVLLLCNSRELSANKVPYNNNELSTLVAVGVSASSAATFDCVLIGI